MGNRCVVTLASGQTDPSAIAVDAVNIYWADSGDGAIREMPVGGGTPSEIGSGVDPSSIAVDATRIYWTNCTGSNVVESQLSGGAAKTLATGVWGTCALAINATSVFYWTASTIGGQDGPLMKIALDGGAPATLVPSTSVVGITVGVKNVYWTTLDGAVMKVTVDGGPTTTLASGLAHPGSIVVDSSSVYFADAGTSDGAVIKVPLGGGSPITLASGLTNPGSMAIDDAAAYFTTGTPDLLNGSSDGAVMKVALDGGPLVTLVSGQNNPAGLAVDSANLYWTVFGKVEIKDGTIMKLTPK